MDDQPDLAPGIDTDQASGLAPTLAPRTPELSALSDGEHDDIATQLAELNEVERLALNELAYRLEAEGLEALEVALGEFPPVPPVLPDIDSEIQRELLQHAKAVGDAARERLARWRETYRRSERGL